MRDQNLYSPAVPAHLRHDHYPATDPRSAGPFRCLDVGLGFPPIVGVRASGQVLEPHGRGSLPQRTGHLVRCRGH